MFVDSKISCNIAAVHLKIYNYRMGIISANCRGIYFNRSPFNLCSSHNDEGLFVFYHMRITKDRITELKPNEIFVFGSNLSGIHGGGAAKLAHDKFGAVWGIGYGIMGQSYAIPTKSTGIKRTLLVEEIEPYVNTFLNYAKLHKENIFLVTEIGCGLAGHLHEYIAPLFKKVETEDIGNIHLPQKFWSFL